MRHGHERELKANNCEFLLRFLLLHSERRTDDELEDTNDNDLFIRSELVVFTLHQIIAQNQWNDLISLKLYLTSSCISNIEITLLLEGMSCPNGIARTSIFQKLEVRCIYVYMYFTCFTSSYSVAYYDSVVYESMYICVYACYNISSLCLIKLCALCKLMCCI
jgi:hypothetical protein